MRQSLALDTPPLASVKRQRSRDSRNEPSRPGSSAGEARSGAAFSATSQQGPRTSIRMPAFLDKNKSDISALFQELEWKQRFRLSHAFNNPDTSPFRLDRSATVINRNRYGNVQPWDASRVKLKKPIGGSDYVNASPITLRSRGSPFSPSDSTPSLDKTGSTVDAPEMLPAKEAIVDAGLNRYIATQGPKEGQFAHFWHMVMQETVGEVGVIVMLTQCYEGNREKCSQYFPRDMDNPKIALPLHEDLPDDGPEQSEDVIGSETPPDSGEGAHVATPEESPNSELATEPTRDSVTLISVEIDPTTASEIRHLTLTINGESKQIFHYLYSCWPDYGKPEAAERKALVNLARVTRAKANLGGPENPRCVHCSAGVGRTGTFIALDYLLHEMETGNLAQMPDQDREAEAEAKPKQTWGRSGPVKESTPDPAGKEDLIYETVNSLREQRMMMVMNEIQFSFLYEVVREVFLERYQVPLTGAVVFPPNAKVPRLDDGEDEGIAGRDVYIGTKSETQPAQEEDTLSEADTEIAVDRSHAATGHLDSGLGLRKKRDEEVHEKERDKDPYAVVAPESIREGAGRES